MRCTSSPVRSTLALAAIACAAIGCSNASARSAPTPIAVDDAALGKAAVDKFEYIGRWQPVQRKFDGRSFGTSMRSTHTGDVAIFNFRGTRVRLYGVMGRSGGQAGISLDGASIGSTPVDFYSAKKNPHAVFYESPVLDRGVHTVTVAVWGTRNQRGVYSYVNIDGAEIDP